MSGSVPIVLATADVEVAREAAHLAAQLAISLHQALLLTYAVASYRARAEQAEAALKAELRWGT